jgi:hypothetical protein
MTSFMRVDVMSAATSAPTIAPADVPATRRPGDPATRRPGDPRGFVTRFAQFRHSPGVADSLHATAHQDEVGLRRLRAQPLDAIRSGPVRHAARGLFDHNRATTPSTKAARPVRTGRTTPAGSQRPATLQGNPTHGGSAFTSKGARVDAPGHTHPDPPGQWRGCGPSAGCGGDRRLAPGACG